MKNKIHLSQFDKRLRTRSLGKNIRDSVNLDSRVVFDFSNIELATQSFCDELFGIILEKKGETFFKNNIFFKNLNSEVETVVKRVIFKRVNSKNLTKCNN